MKDASLLALLEKVYRAEKTAFIRYVVQDSQAEMRDDMDRRVFARYSDWNRECARDERAVQQLLEAEGAAPPDVSFPIEYSQFNYLSPAYLLRHVLPRMETHIRELEEDAEGLAAWPAARDLVRAIAERERIHLEETRKLDQERPAEPPRPPRLKGTSASRW